MKFCNYTNFYAFFSSVVKDFPFRSSALKALKITRVNLFQALQAL